MNTRRSRSFGLSMSLADTKIYMAWLSGTLLGVGCATSKVPLIFGGTMLTLIVMFGFRRLKEDPLP